MKGIILGYEIVNIKKDELHVGDLVNRTDGYDESFYTIIKIDPRYGKLPGYPDTAMKYFLKDKKSGELINFDRMELGYCHLSFFDYDKWKKDKKKILLGSIKACDMNYIRAKVAFEQDLGYSDLHNIPLEDLIGQTFDGNVVEDHINNETTSYTSIVTYFKINNPEEKSL